MPSSSLVRPAAHAGTFYDDDPEALRREVRALLDAAGPPPEVGTVRALVSPHAGYIYSGPPAAHGYHLVEGRSYKRVVIVAPSHSAWFEGVAAHRGEAFETPLGRVPLDREFIGRLIAANPFIQDLPSAHAPEHSLEVQLPFLQVALRDWKLVPLLVARQSWSLMQRLGEALGEALATDPKSTLLVASSDLYHGDDLEACRTSAQRCAEALAEFDPREFHAGIEGRAYEACGAGPITATMVAARRLGATRCHVLSVTNSHETHPSLSRRVVGYLSAALCEASEVTTPR